jgi:nucleoside-diphosphate-sugar epimerase
MQDDAPLTVAVTGPTGTFGMALMAQLETDDRIGRVVGIARRPFDPAAHGWKKMEYRQGDVRDQAALESAFAGVDVVVHLAFIITGNADAETIRAVNIDGTVNVFRAAAAAGARRFVYASSIAAYGFHDDNPIGMTEEWPVRPDGGLFYAQEKAELEQTLQQLSTAHPEMGLYVLRPPVVLGPNTIGAKDIVPGPLGSLVRRLVEQIGQPRRSPVPFPVLSSPLPFQFVHEDDVAQALLLCIVGAGRPGAYNITGDGVVTGDDMVRELGLIPIPVPEQVVRWSARQAARLARLPGAPPSTQWAQAATHPAIMDATKAREQLGWRPRYTSLEALQATLDNEGSQAG